MQHWLLEQEQEYNYKPRYRVDHQQGVLNKKMKPPRHADKVLWLLISYKVLNVNNEALFVSTQYGGKHFSSRNQYTL